MATVALTAKERSLAHCHGCGKLNPVPSGHLQARLSCPRCGAELHLRKPDSINRTWALLIAAIILYIPANLLPVMTVFQLGKGEPDTIMSGVILLINLGMWPLAALIFFASIMVPMLKLVGLTYLLTSVQRRSQWRPKDRTRLYRIVETVGRWSMIDIFVISILVALVRLGNIATIEPGAGATAFGGVVVITMFAASSFDPRLIWDVIKPSGSPNER
jgi:paraquat-inducible protein A